MTQRQANYGIWVAIALGAAMDGLWLRRLGWHIAIAGLGDFVWVMLLCALVSLIHCTWRRDERLFLFGHAINQMICAGLVLGVFSYLAASVNAPLVDPALMAMDRVLGFDWNAYLDWVTRNGFRAEAFTFAYQSFGLQIVLFLCLLFIYHYTAQAQRFVMSFYLTGFACIALGALCPAAGILTPELIRQLQHTHPAFHPVAIQSYPDMLATVRAHRIATIPFPMQGMVMFPSFHSALAILLIYAAWPFKKLRLLFIPLNVLMVLSTPVNGGHYLSDTLAGSVTALLVMALASALLPREQ